MLCLLWRPSNKEIFESGNETQSVTGVARCLDRYPSEYKLLDCDFISEAHLIAIQPQYLPLMFWNDTCRFIRSIYC